MVKKLMQPLGNNISRGERGARESVCPLPFHRSDPRALETGSRSLAVVISLRVEVIHVIVKAVAFENIAKGDD